MRVKPKKPKEMKTCDHCGRVFAKKNYNQHYCCNDCRNEVHNEFKAQAVKFYRDHLKANPALS